MQRARSSSVLPWVGVLVVVMGMVGFPGIRTVINGAEPVDEIVTVTREKDVSTKLDVDSLSIVPVAPKDSIVAILDPGFVSGKEADALMKDAELVIGISINGDSKAYSVAQLAVHEIVNDVVGGTPVAVTW